MFFPPCRSRIVRAFHSWTNRRVYDSALLAATGNLRRSISGHPTLTAEPNPARDTAAFSRAAAALKAEALKPLKSTWEFQSPQRGPVQGRATGNPASRCLVTAGRAHWAHKVVLGMAGAHLCDVSARL